MKTELRTYTVRELVAGFYYSETEGCGLFGMNGMLIIQPEYQRNYLYGDGKRDVAVIRSVLAECPLGVLYFNQLSNNRFEVLDGQQRITTLGRFVQGGFSLKIDGLEQTFSGLDAIAQERILETKILTYHCEGSETEIKNWFRTINIEGLTLKDQELLNAVYSGPFITAAKKWFSNPGNTQTKKWSAYVKGDVKRQDILAKALAWISCNNNDQYMSRHRADTDITELRAHFDDVLNWASTVFIDNYKEQESLDWGKLYRTYSAQHYDFEAIAVKVRELYADSYIKNKKGIFEYVLGGSTKQNLLAIRMFDEATKRAVYKVQTADAECHGVSNCSHCTLGSETRIYKSSEMEADHVTAWSRGGTTAPENCEMLCWTHNRAKGNK